MARFCLPRDVYHGKGALGTLKNLKGRRAIICVGGGSPIDAAKAMGDARTGCNPRQMDAQLMENVLRRCCDEGEVDF